MKNNIITILTSSLLAAMIFFCPQLIGAAEHEAIKIVLISDLNDAYGSTTYSPQISRSIEFIASAAPGLVLCAGDMVAGQSSKITPEKVTMMWDAFKTEILEKIARAGPLFAFTFGNHDGAGQRFVNERNAAISFWKKNRPALKYLDSTGFPEYYSFDHSGIFIAIIDASSAIIKKEQTEWLQQQLSNPAAKQARLRVVMGHLPLYAVSEGRNKTGDVISAADNFFLLLEKHAVDYYISGHHHAFYPSKKGNVKFIAAGCLGGGPRRLIGSAQNPVKTLTILSLFPGDKEFKILTYDMTSEPREISITELPASIIGFNGISCRYP